MRAKKLGVVGAIVAGLAVCGWVATHWHHARSYDWQLVESPDGRFGVYLPGTPTSSQTPTTDALDGSKFVAYRLTAAPRPGVAYAVSWWENPSQAGKTTDELFVHLRECDIKVLRGTIVSENRLLVQGYPAKDTELSGATDGFAVENRVIRVGPRVYSLWVMDASNHRDAWSIKRFFDSFSLHSGA